MSDIDNNSLREIQNKLLKWESQENPLAPLTQYQKNVIFDLAAVAYDRPISTELPEGDVKTSEAPLIRNQESNSELYFPVVDNTVKFLQWYEVLEKNALKNDDAPHISYCKQLEDRRSECVSLLEQVDAAMDDLNKLSKEYELVSDKTNTLHNMSEQLLADQMKLLNVGEEIKQKLHYFTQVEYITQRLSSPTLSVSSELFFNILSKIDECLSYMKQHNNYKESTTFIVKYKHCLNRAISLIRSYATQVLDHATEQVLTPNIDKPPSSDAAEDADTAFAVYFGKFQAAAPKLRNIIKEIENRIGLCDEYEVLLGDIQREYAQRRSRVSGAPAAAALAAAARSQGDRCAALRAACSLLAHAVRDECALYAHFFSGTSHPLEDYLLQMCNGLYDTMRPYIIHINHLETLAEICAILKVEVIEEQVNNDPVQLSALGAAARALLQDAQERLVFRAHVHLRADVLHYRPAPGDLAYPDKLLMMEQIAMSLQERPLKRSDSHASMVSDVSVTSQEVANINSEAQNRPSSSPADLHGMWYPGVRRTLAALSRLYRCLERRVFQGLAQEAISLCVISVDSAAKQISTNKTIIDGELFQIKHLLILREQIAPFQVDFIIKETSLDFSNVKNAAYSLLQKRKQIFALNSNNALLEFLLDGTPMVKEQLLDSRKEVDRQLKRCCESFIKNSTDILAGSLSNFMEKAQILQIGELRSQPWATPEQIGAIIKDTQRRIKSQLAPLQRSMQLYLANKETEFILFRPIRNNVVGYFVQLDQLLSSAGYSSDDKLIVSCPTPEQVSVLISSASLLAGNEQPMPYGQTKRKTSTTQGIPAQTDNKESIGKLENENLPSTSDKAFVV